ncbi:MAG: ECF transporter S component [Clostridiales bacterium]|jgi:niacin transporter|nr:ECF transporter S component [Clostridiales bacterium]
MENTQALKKEYSIPVKAIISVGLVAAAVLLPWLTHMAGGRTLGAQLLPMYLPIILAGFLVGPLFAAGVAALSPVLAFAITGMPPAAALPFMTAELIVYALVCGILYSKAFKKSLPGILLSTALAIIAGKGVYALGVLTFAAVTPLTLDGYFAAIIAGWPGMLIQFTVIPLTVKLLGR